MPDTDVVPEEERSPAELLNSGLVRLHIGDRRYRLRRPFMGEFRRIREAFLEVNDELSDLAMDVQLQGTRIRDRVAELNQRQIGADAPLTSDELDELKKLRQEDRTIARGLTARREELYQQWLTDVFAVLSMDGPLPGDDTSEPWLLDPQFIAELVRHWQTRPLARGGR